MDIYNKILERPIEFDWDSGNDSKNQYKHSVSISECEEAFLNKPIIFFTDEKHSVKERRYGILGITDKSRKLSIVFTIRKDRIRVISARDQSKNDRKIYDKDLTPNKNKEEYAKD